MRVVRNSFWPNSPPFLNTSLLHPYVITHLTSYSFFFSTLNLIFDKQILLMWDLLFELEWLRSQLWSKMTHSISSVLNRVRHFPHFLHLCWDFFQVWNCADHTYAAATAVIQMHYCEIHHGFYPWNNPLSLTLSMLSPTLRKTSWVLEGINVI